jgi:hypothetical protein
MSEADLIKALEQYTESNEALAKAEREKVDLMYKLVVTGNPETGVPSMLEVQRDHEKFINTFKRVTSKGAWIAIGALILAGLSFGWEAIKLIYVGIP